MKKKKVDLITPTSNPVHYQLQLMGVELIKKFMCEQDKKTREKIRNAMGELNNLIVEHEIKTIVDIEKVFMKYPNILPPYQTFLNNCIEELSKCKFEVDERGLPKGLEGCLKD